MKRGTSSLVAALVMKTMEKKRKFWRKPTKIFRDQVFDFVDHVHSSGPALFGVSHFVQIWTILSYVPLIFMPLFIGLYDENSVMWRITACLSYCTLMIPGRNENAIIGITIFLFVCFATNFVLWVYFVVIFHRRGKVPYLVLTLFSYIAMAGPVLGHVSAGQLGVCLYLSLQTSGFEVNVIRVMVLMWMVLLVWHHLWHMNFVNVCLGFRPSIVVFTCQARGSWFWVLRDVFIVLNVWGCMSGDSIIAIAAVVPLAVVMVALLFSFVTVYVRTLNMLLSLTGFGLIQMLVFSVMAMSGLQIPEVLVPVLVAMGIGSVFIIGMIRKSMQASYIEELDRFAADDVSAEEIETMPNRKLLTLLKVSFEAGHKIRSSLRLFGYVVERYPDSKLLWSAFARFCFYRNEDDNAILRCFEVMNGQKEGNLIVKGYLAQMVLLVMVRDMSMNSDIRKSINRCRAGTMKCRSNMRYIWECAFRGDFEDIEGQAEHLYDMIQKLNHDYSLMLNRYANNRFVAESYAGYLRDVDGDRRESQRWFDVAIHLGDGQRIRREYGQSVSKRVLGDVFPMSYEGGLSKVTTKEDLTCVTERQQRAAVLAGYTTMKLEDEDEEVIDDSQYARLDMLVTGARMPSVWFISLLGFLIISILCPVTVFIIYVLTLEVANVETILFELGVDSAIIPAMGAQLASSALLSPLMLGQHWGYTKCYEEFGVPENMYPVGWKTDSDNSWITSHTVSLFQEKLDEYAYFLGSHHLRRDDGMFDGLVIKYYSHNVKIPVTVNSERFTDIFSVHSLCTLLTSTAMHSTTHTTKAEAATFLDSGEIRTLAGNEGVLNSIMEYAQNLSMIVLPHRDELVGEYLLYVLVPTGVCMTVVILGYIFMHMWYKHDVRNVTRVFKEVPKSVAAGVIESLRAPPRGDLWDMPSSKESERRVGSLKALVSPLRARKESVTMGFALFAVSAILVLSVATIAPIFVNLYMTDGIFSSIHMLDNLAQIHVRCALMMQYLVLFGRSELPDPIFTFDECIIAIHALLKTIPDNLRAVKDGMEDRSYIGFRQLPSDFVELFQSRSCEPNEKTNKRISYVPKGTTSVEHDENYIYNHFICENYETSLSYIMHISHALLNGFDFENGDGIVCQNIIWLYTNSYYQVVQPMEDLLREYFNLRWVQSDQYSLMISGILSVVLFGIGIGFVIYMNGISRRIYRLLRLLLFCNPLELFQSRRAVRTLSSDFSGVVNEPQDEYNSFDEIGGFTDPIILCHHDGVISAMNKAAVDSFDGRLGGNMTDILESDEFGRSLENVQNGLMAPFIELTTTVCGVLYHVSVIALDGRGRIIKTVKSWNFISVWSLSFRELSKYREIKDRLKMARHRNEELQTSLLDPDVTDLVRRKSRKVFESEVATIGMIQISGLDVTDEATSFELLTAISEELQSLLSIMHNVIHIRTYGTVYVVAAGVFDDGTMLEASASQVISLALRMIRFVAELGEPGLIVKCGAAAGHTSSGIVTPEIPTFEVLGTPVIRVPYLTESAEPMTVAITAEVNKLIYKHGFNVVDTNPVRIDNQDVATYRVRLQT